MDVCAKAGGPRYTLEGEEMPFMTCCRWQQQQVSVKVDRGWEGLALLVKMHANLAAAKRIGTLVMPELVCVWAWVSKTDHGSVRWAYVGQKFAHSALGSNQLIRARNRTKLSLTPDYHQLLGKPPGSSSGWTGDWAVC